MCGIAGFYIKDPEYIKNHAGVERFVNRLFLGIEARGKHATGFVAMDWQGKTVIDKADKPASEFITDREAIPLNPRAVLLHTRYATKGDPKEHVNNHPVLHGTCFTTHNGRVENDDELFEKYQFARSGEVDTEIIPALIGYAEFEPERIIEVFAEVQGSIACATIDPLNHPEKLLLMRTKTSPLHIIDTPKFLIWASLTPTIKEAWGAVLGTPPDSKRVKYVPEYRCLMVGPDGYFTFDLKKPPVKTGTSGVGYGGYGYWENGKWHRHEDKKEDKREDKREEKKEEKQENLLNDDKIQVSRLEVKMKVLAIRKAKTGLAITWEETDKRFGERWVACPVCDELVKDSTEDFVKTLTRGRMCLDCAHWYNKLWQEKAEAAAKKETDEEADEGSDVEFSIENYMSIHRLNNFNRWSEDEGMAHHRALETMSELTGFNMEALDYLMFRYPHTDETPNDVVDMIQELWAIYEEEYQAEWGANWPVSQEGYKVHLGEHKMKELPKGPSPVIVNNSVPKRRCCLFCKRKAKFCIQAERDTWHSPRYCNKHFVECSTRGCSNKANHTRKDGMRVCHTHSRGVKECHADSAITKMGYVITEVK